MQVPTAAPKTQNARGLLGAVTVAMILAACPASAQFLDFKSLFSPKDATKVQPPADGASQPPARMVR